MDRTRLNKLIKQNRLDKRPLEALDALQCAYDIDEDLQREVLRLKDELDAPEGEFGTLCELVSEMREQAEALFLAYYAELRRNESFESLSTEVCLLLLKTSAQLRSKKA